MLFNSLQFAAFFAVVYSAYLMLSHRWQNRMLLVASYVFYGAWDYRFLSLLMLSTVVDYFAARGIEDSPSPTVRRVLIWVSLGFNLTLLGFFKYFGFFVESMEQLLSYFMDDVSLLRLNIVLPVGISFYTFQTMSYTIDVYRRDLKASRSLLDFALFVSLFPQLVAGPIERATHLLPQVQAPRRVTWEGISEGIYLTLWGLFLKVFVADNLSGIANAVYNLDHTPNGAATMVATYAFAFQIYGDFAGYSNIARGISKMMGFDLMVNFNLPYFAVNPSDFWRRWHISLSTWLRDYLYIPLGGNRQGGWYTYRNLWLTMLIGGLWHGAAWNFIIWGAYQGGMLAIHRYFEPVLKRVLSPKNALLSVVFKVAIILIFFQFTCIGWLIFRARSAEQIGEMLWSLASPYTLTGAGDYAAEWLKIALVAGPVMLVHLWQYLAKDLMVVHRSHWLVRGLFYYFLIMMILLFGVYGGDEFIYFQF